MDEKTRTIHITKPLSSSMIVELFDEYPNLEEITCSRSVYERTSQTYIDALSHLDIEVKKEYNWGAKSKSNNLEDYIFKLAKEGLTAKEISKKLDIKLNRTYYLHRKNNANFNNRKRKYDSTKIKELKNQGLSVKEISEKLGIPLRSVYEILSRGVKEGRIPITSVERILKNAGAQRISADAKIELSEILKQEGNKISQKAISFASCENRKTVKVEDIKLAVKLLYNKK